MRVGESNAEIELSVLARQGLAHNIATIEELCQQVETLAIEHGGRTHQTQTALSRTAT